MPEKYITHGPVYCQSYFSILGNSSLMPRIIHFLSYSPSPPHTSLVALEPRSNTAMLAYENKSLLNMRRLIFALLREAFSNG